MSSNCLLNESCLPTSKDRHCNCKTVSDLEPFHVFHVSRPKRTMKDVESPDSFLSTTSPLQSQPPTPLLSSFREISPSEVAKLYLVIIDREWSTAQEFEILIQIIQNSSYGVKEVLFSLLKRLHHGITKDQEEYSEAAMRKIVQSTTINKKVKQYYRKKILGAFYSFRLSNLQMDHAKVQALNRPNDKRTNFILYYFGDYLQNDGSASLDQLLLDVFSHSNSIKTTGINRQKSAIGNICHLSNLLPKSDLLKADLLYFTKNIFLQDVLKGYDREVERFIQNLVIDFNNKYTTRKAEELRNIKWRIQSSRKFIFPWVKTLYFQAVEHLTSVIETL